MSNGNKIKTAPITSYKEYYENALLNEEIAPVIPVISEPDFIKDVDLMNEYNTNRLLNNTSFEVKGIPYLFITTPMMNMSKANISGDSYLSWLADTMPDVISQLNYGKATDKIYASTNPYIKLLSNMAMSFDPKDSVSKTKEVGETFYGFKLTLPGSNVDSIVGDEVSIKYRDLPGLPVLNLHKAWFDYHNKVRRGILAPNVEAISKHYLDYTSSVYFFMTEMDGTTLQYWCKLTGLVPLNVPYSVFGTEWNSHELIEYTIQYVYSFKEDMNPEILLDFNRLLSQSTESLEINYKTSKEKNEGSNIQGMTEISKPNKVYSPYEDSKGLKPVIVKGTRTSIKGTKGNSKYRLIFM